MTKEERNAYNRKWCADNAEHVRAWRKKHRLANLDRVRKYHARKSKEWRTNNHDRDRANAKRSYENCRESILIRARERRRVIVEETIKHYGGKCACCGEDSIWFLTLDHINGFPDGGRKGRVGGHTFYLKLKHQGWPEGFQVLCYNCNCAKGFFGACPHKGPPPFIRRRPRA